MRELKVIDHLIVLTDITGEEIQLVKDQLKKILSSKYLKSAKMMQRFLEYIVEKAVVGEGEALKQYTIGVEALHFESDFDPDQNPAVRIMGGRLRKRLREYYEDADYDNKIIISIPKGRYMPVFKKNTHVNSNTYVDLSTSRGPTFALASFSDKTQSKNTNRLLLEYTDTLAIELSRFLFLQLVVCNPFSDKEQSHLIEAEMKSADRAEYVLALFFQKTDAHKYRFIYRLALVETGEILWSENYVITDKLIHQQDIIAGKITATVADSLQGMMHTHWSRKLLADRDNIPECYKVIVYFRNFTDRLDAEALTDGVNVCLEALNRNPNDVIANMVYAGYCRREYAYGYGVIESPLEKGMECIETAIRLSPNAPGARYVHGLILFCQNEWERCAEEFEVARSLSKNHIVLEHGIGFHYCKMGQWDKGLKLVNKAMQLSTAYPSSYHVVPFLDYYRQEKYEKALYEAKKITTLGTSVGPIARCISYAQLGRLEEAEKEFQEILRRYPEFMLTGRMQLSRYFGAETLAEKVWDGILKVSLKFN